MSNDETMELQDTDSLADAADESAIPAAELDAASDEPIGGEQAEQDWRVEYLREVSQSRKYRQRAQRAEAEAEQLSARALNEEQLAEYRRLRQGGADLESRDQRISALEGMVRRIAGMNELGKALVACGVGSACPHGEKMVSQAAALLADRIDVDVSGDSPAVRVLDDAGRQPMQDDDGQPISVHQFVSSWLAEEGSHFLPASGDTGSGAHRGRSTPPGASIEQLDRDPRAKAEFIAKHGPQAYVQLARKQR